MDSEEFVRFVTQRAGLDRGQAQAAVRSTLQVLADAVSVEQAHQLAGQLPDPLRDAIADRTGSRDGADAEALDLDAFRARVAERSGLAPTGIDDAIAAVLAALEQAAPGEFSRAMEQLPDDFRALLGEAPPVDGR